MKDALFYRIVFAGFFMLPFENFIIAPSSGWPALSPLVFLLALVFRSTKFSLDRKEVIVLLFGFTLSCLGWSVSENIGGGNRNFFGDVVGGLTPLLLGLCFYRVMTVVLSDRGFFKASLDFFFWGSVVALIASIVILVFGYLLKVGFFIEFLGFILKRNHEMYRFSFLFAEPSFVSVHVLGVLVPFAWISWRLDYKLQFKRMLGVLFCYVLVALIFMDSARFILDVVFLFFVVLFFYYSKSFLFLRSSKLFALSLVFVFFVYVTSMNLELLEVVTFGRVSGGVDILSIVNSDPSLASRFFRTDAVYQALIDNPIFMFTGVGFGNIGYLVDLGFYDASMNYMSNYTVEIDNIYLRGSGSNIFNMYARVVGEFGVLVALAVPLLLYSRRVAFLFFIVGWCYVQFDSYAFYGVWIYLAVAGYFKKNMSASV